MIFDSNHIVEYSAIAIKRPGDSARFAGSDSIDSRDIGSREQLLLGRKASVLASANRVVIG